MTLAFQPRPAQVLMCDFAGYVVPEMIKVRPVVVVARNRRNRHLVTVVPLSTTAPDLVEDYHHALSANPLPGKERISCWAKCDMIATVSLARLDRVKIGRRNFIVPTVSPNDFLEIQRALTHALSLRGVIED